MAEEERTGGYVWLVSGVLMGAIVAVVGMTLAQRTRPAAIEILPPEPTPTTAPSPTPGPFRVYITGAVNHPAVYELTVGSIVSDAVQAAGGFADEAAREMVNLALPLSDGMHVHIPVITAGTEENNAPEQPPAAAAPIIVSADADPGPRLVNINTAGATELETLPGVGPVIAQSIIDHRQANGPFNSIDEILEVSGIGPAKFEQLKEMIVVD